MKKAAVSIFLAFALLSSPTTPAFGQKQKTAVVTRSERYYRTELYFGQSIPGGGRVTEDDWEDFLLNEVTPRFREGFTVLDARGQWMQEDDEVIKEPTKLVLFFYRASKRTTSRRKIEEIRRAYIKRFKQESVLRLDFPAAVDVTF